MKNKIFSNQLKQLLIFQLKSPFYYFLGISFSLISAINFYVKKQFFSTSGSTDLILFFSVIPYLCSIALPALCYEKTYSCFEDFIPLKRSSKVLCNFLSNLILFIIILIISSLTIIPVAFFGTFDFGKYFTSIITLIFIGAAIISICIFFNELINSKIGSVIFSILILIGLNTLHLIVLYIPVGNFLSIILKNLSIAWHFDAAGKGILDTRDIIWLLFTTALFLAFTSFTQELKAENHNKKFKLFYFGQFILYFLIMLNGTRYYKRLDFSQNKTYSLSKYSKTLIKTIESPVKITYYRSSALNRLYPQVRDVADFLAAYSEQNKNISFTIQDPDKDQNIQQILEDYGIISQQMKTIKNNSTEYINVYSAIIIENQGNFETIPFTLTADSLEYDLAGRLKHLLFNQQRVVNIIIGNGMNYETDYSYIVPWLSSQGFVVNPIFIQDPNFSYALENTSGLLFVIGDSQIDINKAISIENYILNSKGNVLFNISPFSVDIENDWNVQKNQYTNLIEVLENWGLYFPDEITGDISCSSITMYSQDEQENPLQQSSTYAKVLNYPLWVNALPQNNSKYGSTFFWASPIEILNDNVEPYIISTPAAYSLKFDRNSPAKPVETNPFILDTVNTSNYTKETKNLAVKISGSLKGLFNNLETSNQEIIVISDQYFLNSLMTGYNSGNTGDYRNFDLITNILLKLNGEEELAELQSRTTSDTTLYKITDLQQFIKIQLLTYLYFIVFIPVLFSIVCLVSKYILKRGLYEK